jgi:protein CpxP
MHTFIINGKRIFDMRRWFKRTLIGLFGATLVIGSLSGCSHGGRHGNWSESDISQMRLRILDKAGKQLDLDDAQKQRLAALADKLQEQRAAFRSGNDPRAEVQSLVAGSRFDRDKAQALVEAKTAAIRAKSPDVIAAAADFYDSLRPEQQQKVRDFMNRGRGWGRRS